MAQSNTSNESPVDPQESTELSASEQQREKEIEGLQKTISDLGITSGLLTFKYPDDEDGTFRTVQIGHFYDSLQMISEYCKRAKLRVMNDLEGIG